MGATSERHAWRVLAPVVIRSTGFPVDLCERLRAPVADELVAAEDRLAAAVTAARNALHETGDGKWRKQAARALGSGATLDPPAGGLEEAAGAALGEYNRALAARDAARGAAAPRFDEALLAARRHLIDASRGADLREVLFAASDTAAAMAARLAERPIAPATNYKQRTDEDRIALFLQRLCGKNETASFYGPLFWGRADGDQLVFEVGEGDWIARRVVLIEHWAVTALGAAIADDPEVAPYLRPRLNPACRLDGAVLHAPVGKRIDLPDNLRRLVELADGTRTAGELRALDAEGFDLLRQKRILRAAFDVPTDLRCEEALRRDVAALPDACGTRAQWLERLDELAGLAVAYRDADLAGRARARGQVDERFRAWAATDAARGQGRMFVGRRVVHELCGRNVTRFELGPVGREVERLLAPMCDIARWSYLALTDGFERRMADALGSHAATGGAMDLLSALRVIRPLEKADAGGVPEVAARQLLEAWRRGAPAAVGAGDAEVSRHQLDAVVGALPRHDSDLAPAELFGADFHSPDILLAARDAGAIARGDYRVVMGELHAAVFSVSSPIYLPFCPFPELVAAAGAALAGPGHLVLADSPGSHNLGDLLWPDVPGLREVVSEGAASRFGPAREVPIADLAVELDGRRIYVVSHRERLRVRLLSLYQSFLHRVVFAMALVPYEGARAGRVTHERAVLRRRSWRFSAAERPPVDPTQVRTLDGHVALRRWQAQHGLPDRIFSRVAGEPKPVMVDLRSPLLCAAWLRLFGDESSFSAAEMMPDPDHMWLVDGRGRCSSEIRLTMTCQP